MRKLSELYTILLENYSTQGYDAFICNNISELNHRKIISEEEAGKLYNHFRKEIPSKIKGKEKHLNFANHHLFIGDEGQGVWFKLVSFREEGREIRKDFIKFMISLTEAEDI